jgi:hypothetical protein
VTERTVSGSSESEQEPHELIAALADATRVSEWAPAFADSAVRQGDSDRWRGTKSGREFTFRVPVNEVAGTVDYLREVEPGRETGAYVRVVPRPGGGSVVLLTLPIRPGSVAAEVRATLEAEVSAIAHMA